MITNTDDPFGKYEFEGYSYRPLYIDPTPTTITYVSECGIVRTYFTLFKKFGKPRIAFLPSNGTNIMIRTYTMNGWKHIMLQKVIGLSWFHSNNNWKRDECILSNDGKVIGWKIGSISRIARRGIHLKSFVSKYNSFELYENGYLTINGLHVSGVSCEGQRWCSIPNEGMIKLSTLITKILNFSCDNNPCMTPCVVYRDGNPDNLSGCNLILVNMENRKLPNRYQRILQCFLDEVVFENVPERLGISVLTVQKYILEMVHTNRVSDDFIRWIIGTNLLEYIDYIDDIRPLKQILDISQMESKAFFYIRLGRILKYKGILHTFVVTNRNMKSVSM